MRFYLISLFFFIVTSSLAQSVIADFAMPTNGCLNETIKISNQSVNAVSYEWDFCQGDLSNLPTATDLGGTLVANNSPSIKMVNDGTNWFGFVADKANSNILRLDFGTSIDNLTPTKNNLGNISNAINSPIAIDIAFSNGNWYGFVLGDNTSVITRIDFGASLTTPANQLVATTLLTDVPQPSYGDIDLVLDSNQWYIVFTRVYSVQVARLVTITSIPTSSDFLSTGDIPSAFSYLAQIKTVKYNGIWYGYTVSIGNNKLFKLTFGSSLFNVPTYQDITGPTGAGGWIGSTTPTGLGIGWDDGAYYLIVGTSGGLARLTLGSDLSIASIPSGVFLGNLSVLQQINKMDMVKYNGVWRAFVCATFSSDLYKISFPHTNCGNAISILAEPTVTYSTSGIQGITLRAYSDAINYIEVDKAITISSLLAPSISFSYANNCVASSIGFTYQSNQTINIFNWNFGDSNSSNAPNPSHQYSLAGKFVANLNVTASNGCANYTSDTVKIYNAPSPSFPIPAGLICTNQNYIFSNTSTFDNGSNPTWQWSVNGTNVASTKNLNYLIPSATAQTILLTASIAGCSSQSSQNIPAVQVGPLVGFNSPATGCVSKATSFFNTTTGSVTSYGWAFGDAHTSSQTNASNTFANTGSYLVTLTANNAAGCQNNLSKNISIYSNPQPAFAIELPPFSCANSPAQFDNNTPPLVDSNIATWGWGFGDSANGTSNQKNPSYTYTTAANYNVSLQATTNFGCTNTVQQSVAISASPQAAFSNNPACVNQNTQFTDASSGSITNYLWTVQGTSLTGNIPPVYTFKSAGTYPVMLTVYGSNGCNNQIIKNITVPIPPVVDFTVQTPCASDPTIFQELNPGGVDPTTAWNWNFGSGQSSGTGSPVSYTFPTANGYSITLSTTRQSGCIYSYSKPVSIYTPPTASFTTPVQAGAAPLNVTFNNTSSLTDSSLWQFGDASKTISKISSPTFTYTKLGEYKALLTAINYNGAYSCMDTASVEISVVIPRIDLAMKSFSLKEDPSTSSSKATVTISNLGNIPFTNPEVDIDLGGGALLRENLAAIVQPGQSVVQTLDLEIVPQSISYICANVIVANDVDFANDKQCLTLTGEDVIFSPYPNPVVGNLNFDWVSSSAENVIVTIYQSNGQVTFEQTFQNVLIGLGQLSINTSSLANGLYLVRFSGAKAQQTFRIMVAH